MKGALGSGGSGLGADRRCEWLTAAVDCSLALNVGVLLAEEAVDSVPLCSPSCCCCCCCCKCCCCCVACLAAAEMRSA